MPQVQVGDKTRNRDKQPEAQLEFELTAQLVEVEF
jgi:hypothetical protein